MTLTDRQIRSVGPRLLLYRPLPTQGAFHASPAKYRWPLGGNRSGKSESNIGYDLCSFALRVHPFRQTPRRAVIWAIAPTWDMVGKILWQEKIQHYIPPARVLRVVWHEKRKDIPAELQLDNHVTIEFKSFDQGRIAFQGRAIDAIYPDEQCDHDYEMILHELQMRLRDAYTDPRDAGCQRFMSWSMTPLVPQPKVQERVENPGPRDAVFYANLNENRQSLGGHIPDEDIDELIAEWPEEVQATRIAGHFAAFLGVVYQSFRRDIHVRHVELPADCERYRAIDFGFANPFCCLWLARYGPDEAWHVYAEHYGGHRSLAWHAEQIKAISGAERYVATWADHEQQEAYELELNDVPSLPAKKHVLLGIEVVQSKLKVQADGKVRLTIEPSCLNLVRQMTGYRWPEGTDTRDPQDKPVKKDDHAVDALRYAIYSVDGDNYFRR